MRITRRDFLKYCSITAGALGLSSGTLLKIDQALALNGGTPVVWLAGAACTGCTMTLTNSIYYTDIASLLLGTLDLKFHDTLMAQAGDEALSAAHDATADGEVFVLCVEGAVPTAAAGAYCTIGDVANISNETMYENTVALAKKAALVLSIGQCACFGGIPAAKGSQTGSMGVLDACKLKYGKSSADYKKILKKTINIPGCPPNPDWIVGTIATFLTSGMPRLDSFKRPLDYYGQTHCFSCTRYASQNTRDNFASKFDGQYATEVDQLANKAKCLKQLGCKGRVTKTDCPVRLWNGATKGEVGVNYCVTAGFPCHGCTQPGFPDKFSPFVKVT